VVSERDEIAAASLRDLERELAWFVRLLDLRLRRYFPPGPPGDAATAAAPDGPDAGELAPPDHGASPSPWAGFLREHALGLVERTALVLALVPHLRPQLLDVFFTRNSTFDRRFTEFGGWRVDDDFEPTGETLAFVLGGDALDARLAVARLLEPDHPLIRGDVLRVAAAAPGRDPSPMKSALRISPEYLSLLTLGHRPRPVLGAEFPAQRLDTALGWDDLVLHPGTRKQLGEIEMFLRHGHTLLHDWQMAARLRAGHRALFHGPPGTGKSLTAALLGKTAGRDVHRVDLSLVVSKYIGETEKNLSRVFDRAQRQDWILFFDEADALFGKRTETRDAHDRYANQEVAYLLQRIETFDGVVILASNMRDNLDPAFARRFESVIYFPLPRPAERLALWQRGVPARARLDPGVDLAALAEAHELSGGAIMNAIRQVSLVAIADGERPITGDDFANAVRRELAKDGKRA
jgi:ATPase family protein associated with various cellular activities (AAA)